MKTQKLLSIALISAAVLVSCEKKKMDPYSIGPMDFKKAEGVVLEVNIPSSPTSDAGIIPFIIPGDNNGGNRTCDEVAVAFTPEGEPKIVLCCGDKLDYNGNNNFSGEFPDGLVVTVTDEKFVEFSIDGCIEIGDDYYKVGAVIVKGSNQANVYFYEYGSVADFGLAAPVNASGEPAGLSNLSFCLVPCDPPQDEKIYIAVKVWYWNDVGAYKYALSTGEMKPFAHLTTWCGSAELGVNEYVYSSSFSLHNTDMLNAGEVTIDNNGDVTVILSENFKLHNTYVFVGTMEALMDNPNTEDSWAIGCPSYSEDWLHDGTQANSVTLYP